MLNLKRVILLSTFLFLYTGSLHAQWIKTTIPRVGDIRCLVISRENVFAGTDDGRLFRFSNNGKKWIATNTGLPSNNSYVQALAVSDTNLFVGTIWVEGDDGKGGDGGVFLSTNSGESWSSVDNGLTNNNVRALAVSGTNLFAGTWGGGVFHSADNGSRWTAVNNGLTHSNVFALAVSGTNLFAGTPIGVFRSVNNGRSWTQVNSGLTKNFVWSLAVSGTDIIAGTDGGAYLSTNNGTSWELTALKNVSVSGLAVSGSNLFARTDGGVFLSTNNGISWIAVNTGLTNRRTTSLAVSDTTLFAGTKDGIWTRPLSQMIKSDQPITSSESSTISKTNSKPKPQAKVINIKPQVGARITPVIVGKSIKFPIVKLSEQAKADRINKYLRDSFFKDLGGFDSKKTLQKNLLGSYEEIGYKVVLNTPNILSIEIWWNNYRAGDSTQYHFDLTNGEVIALDQIIEPSTLDDLKKLVLDVSKKRFVQVKNKILKDMKDPRGGWSGGQGLWYEKDILGSSYEDAYQNQIKKNYWEVELDQKFKLSNTGISFYYQTGFGFPMSILSDEPSAEYFFSWASLRPFLLPSSPISTLVK